jgi:hypothetical protein
MRTMIIDLCKSGFMLGSEVRSAYTMVKNCLVGMYQKFSQIKSGTTIGWKKFLRMYDMRF